MGPKLFTAIRLYVDGVRDGHLHVTLDKYVASEPVRTALTQRYGPLIDAYDRRSVIPLRGFEDGSRVFVHTFQSFGLRQVERIGIDVFDTDGDDHIVGYHGVAMPLADRSRGGASQVDGPTHVEDLAATTANKALVRAYAREVLIDGAHGRAAAYVTGGPFVEHDPDPPEIRYTAIDTLVGSGSLVATVARATVAFIPHAIGDLYRIADGRIVEHWSAREPVSHAPGDPQESMATATSTS